MSQTPPPYANVTGISRADMKDNAQETLGAYDGNARPGELVVDLTTYQLYIGNADGNLNIVTGGGNGSPGGANTQVQYNSNGLFAGDPTFTFDTNVNVLSIPDTMVTGNVIPTVSNTYSLGSPTNQWKDMFVSANTIYINNVPLSGSNTGLTYNNQPVVVASNTAPPATSDISTTAAVVAGNVVISNTTPGGGIVFPDGTVQTTASTGNGGGNYGNANVSAYLASGTMAANIITNAGVGVGADLLVGGTISGIGNIIGNRVSGATGAFTAVTATTASATGNVTGGNLVTAGVVSASGVTANTVTATVSVNTANVTGGGLTLTSTGLGSPLTLSASGNIVASGAVINNVGAPVVSTDAATKGYVDANASGLKVIGSSRLATAATLPAYTYSNGTAGVGATLTATANGALSVDGVAVNVADRILVKNETGGNAPYNGVYTVTATGGAGAAYVLTRATDDDVASEMPGAYTLVTAGTVNANTGWTQSTAAPIVIGTTNIAWSQFSNPTTYSAGNAMSLVGSTFNVDPDNSTIIVNGSDQLAIKSGVTLVNPNIANATYSTLSVGAGATGNVQAGNVTVSGSIVTVGDVTANYFSGNGSLLSGIVASNIIGTVATANTANYAAVAGTVAGGNVSGTVAFANSASFANVANTATVATTALSVAGANVTGTVANATYATTAGTAYSVAGSNVTGVVANATLATVATTALSVAGSNVSGAVANATYATTAGLATTATTAGSATTATTANVALSVAGANVTGVVAQANTANVALSVAGANVTGAVANATYAISAGSATTATTANVALSVALANVTGAGNIASVNLNGSNAQVLAGDGTWITPAGSYSNATVSAYLASGNNTAGYTTTGNVTAAGLTVGGNATVTGNLTVSGNLNYQDVTNLVVGDPLIYIGANNTGNVVDLGMVVSYNDGTYQHGGWARDASDGTWKLFGNVVAEPTTTIDFTNAIYQPLLAGAVSATGNVTGSYILGNISQATGLGNIVATNLNGNGSTYLAGNGSWQTVSGGSGTYGNANVATYLASGTVSTDYKTTGNISATANVTANVFLGNGSQLTGIVQYSNAAVSNYLASGTNTANIVTTGNIAAGTTISTLPNTIVSVGANVDSYAQINFQNKSSGTNAEADFVVTADNGNDTTNYVNIGIVNSAYDNATPTNSLGNIIYAADSYVYAQGNVSNATQSGGNLAIGTTTSGKQLIFFAGGNTNASIAGRLGGNVVALGTGAGTGDGVGGVAIGWNAGTGATQGANTVAIGRNAGSGTQYYSSIAIGWNAGAGGQSNEAIAIGAGTAFTAQNYRAVALGTASGQLNQGINAIAIGYAAGQSGQGANSIAIGTLAGKSLQSNNSIVINATGAILDAGNQGLYAAPVRNDTGNVTNAIYYNTSTKELTYGPTPAAALPQFNISGNITLTANQGGAYLYSTTTTANTVTVPTNATVAMPNGTTITIVLQGTGSLVLAPAAGVTMYLGGNATPGNRTVSPYGIATLLKVSTDTWFINGTGVA